MKMVYMGRNGEFKSFDLYSMRQSIGEGFTLDVLKDYTTYQRYFKLNKTVEEDKELPESRVKKMLVNWVDIQPHTIHQFNCQIHGNSNFG